jgi:hypothetical protein
LHYAAMAKVGIIMMGPVNMIDGGLAAWQGTEAGEYRSSSISTTGFGSWSVTQKRRAGLCGPTLLFNWQYLTGILAASIPMSWLESALICPYNIIILQAKKCATMSTNVCTHYCRIRWRGEMQIRGYSVDDHFMCLKNVATAPISRSSDPSPRSFPDL